MTKVQDYRTLQAALDDVLVQLQSDNVDIDQATELYERGQKLVADIRTYLQDTENRITKLKATFDKAS